MGVPTKGYIVRLSPPLARRLEETHRHLPAMTVTMIHRCLLRAALELPLNERLKIVQEQLRRPTPED